MYAQRTPPIQTGMCYNCHGHTLVDIEISWLIITPQLIPSKILHKAMMELHNERVSATDIAKRLGFPRSTVHSELSRLRKTGAMDDRPRSGRPRTASSSEAVTRIREKIRREPRRSIRKLARAEGHSDDPPYACLQRSKSTPFERACEGHETEEMHNAPDAF
ncbi:unnamed protein product [Nippostrongylus brasiliensis]|uniref:Winged helix-turn-helix transcriptional regulator n=1 Tax=Nippostrongylus brasiliensis TaxID=27835 RepID=A0A0N4XUP6_NIPBR|nr:unnamed protein product [Nippostrongylus brasiliensis]